jgi:hypothetical protein
LTCGLSIAVISNTPLYGGKCTWRTTGAKARDLLTDFTARLKSCPLHGDFETSSRLWTLGTG